MSKEVKNEVAIQLNQAVGSVLNQVNLIGFEKAYATAKSIETLKTLLTPEYMHPIMQLQGNRLGFKTDKDKGSGYPVDVVKNCLIEAVLMGLQPYGNEFNIIAGNTYPTKEGLGRVLATWNGLQYTLVCAVPKPQQDGKSAVIDVSLKWTINNKEHSQVVPIAVKMDAYTSVDALVGKATRKGRAWLLSAISGIEITDGDITDAEFLEVKQGTKDYKEASLNKQYDRVVAHIDVSTTLVELEKCVSAIREEDHDLIEKYSYKHIELSSNLIELQSLKFASLINEESDFDFFIIFTDKLKEFGAKK
jgi:hypothetical protein